MDNFLLIIAGVYFIGRFLFFWSVKDSNKEETEKESNVIEDKWNYLPEVSDIWNEYLEKK